MSWPALGEEPVVQTIILDDKRTPKSAAPRWAREKEAEVGVGVWMWWTDGSRSDDGRVGVAAVCKHSEEWRTWRCDLGTERVEVFNTELWAIGLMPGETVKRWKWLQEHRVNTVALFSDSQAAIRRTAHLELGPGHRLARRINRRAQALLAHGIATEIHLVTVHSGIPRNEEADHQAKVARDTSGIMATERPYTSASNRAGRIAEERSAATAKWKAEKWSKHFRYRLKGATGTKRPVPMASMKLLATRFYRAKCGQCTHWSLPETVRQPRGRQMVVLRWRSHDGGPDAGTTLPPLQPVERPEKDTMEGGVKGDGMESWEMQTCADIWAGFHGRVRPSSDGPLGSYWSREVPAQMNDGIEEAQRLTQVRGSGSDGGLYPFLLFLLFLSFPFPSLCSV